MLRVAWNRGTVPRTVDPIQLGPLRAKRADNLHRLRYSPVVEEVLGFL
jgi:hypothetical protein